MQRLRSNPYYRVAQTLLREARHNLSARPGEILFVRDLYVMDRYNDHFLSWVERRHPRSLRHMRLGRITKFPLGLSGVRLLVPWLQDPLRESSPICYARAMQLQSRCAGSGIGVVNPVDHLSNSVKSTALEIIRGTGIRTAEVARIAEPSSFDPAAVGLSFPLIVREDHGHGGPMINVADRAQLARVPWTDFRHPIAMEFIDTRSDDGRYRKYRYVMMSNVGVPRHLVISDDWCVHVAARVHEDALRREELDYLAVERDPNHERLDRARQALGFDIVAFDYGYDRDGELVVWEPNPFPTYWTAYNERTDSGYQKPTMDRLYAELLNYYFMRAGLEPPARR